MSLKIKLKHSSTAGKVPTAGDLDAGEVALNTSDVKAYIKNAGGAVVQLAGNGSVPDASETATGVVELATAAETTTGTDATRAVHPAGLRVELDKKVNKAGDTMTGALVLPAAAPTADAEAANKKYVDDQVAAADEWTQAGNNLYPKVATSDVKIGGTLPGTPQITLAASGSIVNQTYTQTPNAVLGGPEVSSDGVLSVRSNGGVETGLFNTTTLMLGAAPGGLTEASATLIFRQNGTAQFAGDVKIGGTLPTSPNIALNADGSATFTGTVTATVVPPSDARFKENIQPANPQLADVVALGGILKNYNWNADAPVNDELRATRQLGLIAQEAEKVCPGLVKTIHRTKQGKELTPEQIIPAVYRDAVDPQDEENHIQELVTPEQVIPATYEELDDSYKGLSTDVLIMKLLGAVAELNAEVHALKNAH